MQQVDILFPILLAVLAGLSTGLGGLFVILSKRSDARFLAFSLGLSAGVMIYVAFVELLSAAVASEGFLAANIAFFAGIMFIMAIDFFVPHDYIAERVCRGTPMACCGSGFGMRMPRRRKLAIAGAFTAIGIAIHNLPEGLSVFLGGVYDPSLGVALAFAIAMHNIPEGIAIAMPIYCSTKNKAKAMGYAMAAGLAEPAGALIGAAFLLPFLNQSFLSLSLSFVGGIMVFISFDELLPLCFESRTGKGHASIVGIIIGMMVMAISLNFL